MTPMPNYERPVGKYFWFLDVEPEKPLIPARAGQNLAGYAAATLCPSNMTSAS
jgi:hypothetical protein